MVTTRLFTVEDLARMPDEERYELVRGELREVPMPEKPHGRIMGRIAGPLWLREATNRDIAVYVGDVGIVLERDPDTVLLPDIAVAVGTARSLRDEEDGYFLVPPDLVVETFSPSQSRPEMREKIARYLAFGVPLAWLVEPRTRTISRFDANGETVFAAGDVLDGGAALPGFALPVADVFA